MPTRASSQPASPRRSTSTSGFRSSSASWYFRVKVYSIVLLLCAVGSLLRLTVRGAVIHDASQGACVVTRALRRAPHAGDAELAATTLLVVVGTVDPSPGVTAARIGRAHV